MRARLRLLATAVRGRCAGFTATRWASWRMTACSSPSRRSRAHTLSRQAREGESAGEMQV
eukprot:3226101-Pleurochrysis_carterae.AAC.1